MFIKLFGIIFLFRIFFKIFFLEEVDTRFTLCAFAALYLLDCLNAIDVEKAVEFILKCYNFDGGFGTRPGSESHSGQVILIF